MTLEEKVLKMKAHALADKEEAFENYERYRNAGRKEDAEYWYNRYQFAQGEACGYIEVLHAMDRQKVVRSMDADKAVK